MTSLSFYSTQTSRHERLTYFSHAIEKEQGRSLAFQSLDKKDRIEFLALCNISISTIHWNKIGKQKMKNSVHQLIHGPKLPNLLQVPPQAMTKAHLIPLLTGKDLANLQSTHKAASELDSATHIIKTYHLAPLIAKYCHRYCATLAEDEQIKILNQLMSFAKDLSELEHLEAPNYQSVAKFFEIVEARNLLRMATKMHLAQPLAGLENAQLKIAADSESTLQRAEKVREWFGQHQADLRAFNGLDLHNSNLTLLPPEIGQLSGLIVLDLADNYLTKLPKEIGQLRALSLFSLQHNRLIGLPKEIGQLRALNVFILHNNLLISLPKEIGQLRALTMLDLNRNRLTSLPKEIGQLRALTMLDLNGNRLTSLPKEIGQLRALTDLWISNNRLTSVPKEIGQLRALTDLWISNNRLTSVPKEIGRLRRTLMDLDLKKNRLTSLPKEIGQLRALQNFTVDGNGLIDRLPAGLGGYSIGVQNKALQMKTILGRLRRCLKGKHDCKGIAVLLDKMEKFQGKKVHLKLHGCIYKACKQEKSLTTKMKSSQFGRKALIDPTIDPKLKLAGLERFELMFKNLENANKTAKK